MERILANNTEQLSFFLGTTGRILGHFTFLGFTLGPLRYVFWQRLWGKDDLFFFLFIL